MTMVWYMDSPGFIFGWTRRGEIGGFNFSPATGMRCVGSVSLATESAPVPIFGGGLSQQQFTEGLAQLVDPKLGRLFEMKYDPAAGTIHGRYPNSRNATFRTSCLLYRDIPADQELVPMVIFGSGAGITASIIDIHD
jgi:hypothetical protein